MRCIAAPLHSTQHNATVFDYAFHHRYAARRNAPLRCSTRLSASQLTSSRRNVFIHLFTAAPQLRSTRRTSPLLASSLLIAIPLSATLLASPRLNATFSLIPFIVASHRPAAPLYSAHLASAPLGASPLVAPLRSSTQLDATFLPSNRSYFQWLKNSPARR
jgi:hypothetical protein